MAFDFFWGVGFFTIVVQYEVHLLSQQANKTKNKINAKKKKTNKKNKETANNKQKANKENKQTYKIVQNKTNTFP